jgi:type IV fimbrial biogenesis protein FimT
MSMKEKGFTLIELMLAMGLMVIMLGLAGEGFVAAASRYQGKTVTAELAAELRAARYLAIMRRERVRVVFEPEGARVRTERADEPKELIRLYEYGKRRIVLERLSNGPSIIFYPSGRAATANTIMLRNGQEERLQITVSLTGRISIL